MYYGGGSKTQHTPDSQSLPFEFVSLSLRGRTDGFTLKGGDATQGPLMTQYDGPRPDPKIAGTCGNPRGGMDSYQPMRKKGAIILATGGDYSNSAMGKFYEGYMVTGATTDATDAKVQANIVACRDACHVPDTHTHTQRAPPRTRGAVWGAGAAVCVECARVCVCVVCGGVRNAVVSSCPHHFFTRGDPCNQVAVGYKNIPKPCQGAVGTALCGCGDDGTSFRLACFHNGTITAVTFAAVGTPGGKCGHMTVDSKCNGDASSAKAYVERTCVGKTSCELDADIDTFNGGKDPCVGTPKHAEVQVVCSTLAPPPPPPASGLD